MGSRRPRASQYLWDGRQVNRLSSVPSLKNAGWQTSQPFNVRSIPRRRLSKPRNNADSRCSSMISHNRSLRALWDGGEKTAESACRPAPRTIRVLGKHHRKADAHPHPQQEPLPAVIPHSIIFLTGNRTRNTNLCPPHRKQRITKCMHLRHHERRSSQTQQ